MTYDEIIYELSYHTYVIRIITCFQWGVDTVTQAFKSHTVFPLAYFPPAVVRERFKLMQSSDIPGLVAMPIHNEPCEAFQLHELAARLIDYLGKKDLLVKAN
jgi:hypothetical protein